MNKIPSSQQNRTFSGKTTNEIENIQQTKFEGEIQFILHTAKLQILQTTYIAKYFNFAA